MWSHLTCWWVRRESSSSATLGYPVVLSTPLPRPWKSAAVHTWRWAPTPHSSFQSTLTTCLFVCLFVCVAWEDRPPEGRKGLHHSFRCLEFWHHSGNCPNWEGQGGWGRGSPLWHHAFIILGQLELCLGAFPYGRWTTIFEQLNAVVNGPPPRLPDDGRFSLELQEFSAAW